MGEVPTVAVGVAEGVDIVVVVLLDHDAVARCGLVHRDVLVVRLPIHLDIAQLRVATSHKNQQHHARGRPGGRADRRCH